MPIDRVKLTDGSTLDYYVPVGVSVEESTNVYAPAALKKVEMGIDPLEPPETTLGGYVDEIGKGLASGAAGLVESAATGAAFLLPEEAEQAARQAIAEKGAEVQRGLLPAAGYEDTVARKFAEAAGSTVPFIATGAFGGLGALAGRAALGTGIGLGAAAGAGEAAKRAEAAGATEEQISKAAGLGLIPGLGETLVPFAIGKSIRAGVAARGLGKSLGEAPAGDVLSRLRRVAGAAGGEGLQEASAEVAQNLISQGVYDPETGTFTGTGESLGYGAGVGGLLAALAELAIPGKPRRATTTEPAEPTVAPVAATEPTVEPTVEPTAEPTVVTEQDLEDVGAGVTAEAAPAPSQPIEPTDEEISQMMAEAAEKEEQARQEAIDLEEAEAEAALAREEKPLEEVFAARDEAFAAQQAELESRKEQLADAAKEQAQAGQVAQEAVAKPTDEDIYTQAVEFATKEGTISASSLQRKFRIGYNRAARIVEQMEESGVVSPRDSRGIRTVLPTAPVADLETDAAPAEAPVVDAPVVDAPVDTQEDVAGIADESIDLEDADAAIAAIEEQRQAAKTPAPTGREEDSLLIYTEAAAKPKGPVGKYFAAQKDFQGGIDALAQDLVATDQKKIPKEAKSASDWIRKNLSAAANKDLRRAIVEFKATLNDLDGLPLPANAIAATSQPLPQQIRDNLSAGNLRAAINNLTQSADQTVSRVATAIEKGLGNTKVVMASGLTNSEGKTAAGLYDPKTDTITLNQDIPLKNHVLLHESMHAVTSHEIAKNTPAAQQMRSLFESVKDRLDTAYGSTNLDEFVAEAFSNPEFQAKLGKMNARGEDISFWSRFKNIVNNIMRRFRGQPSKKIGSAMDKADQLVEELISPAPESRDAAKLYSASVEGKEKSTLNALGRFAKGKLRDEDIATASALYTSADDLKQKIMNRVLPLNSLYQIAKEKYPLIGAKAQELFQLLQLKNGLRQKYLNKTRDTASLLEERIGKDKVLRETLNDWVGESTIARVDPTKPRTTYLGEKDKLESWDLMRSLIKERGIDDARLAKLEATYNTLRDSYATVYKQLLDTLNERLDKIQDEKIKLSLKDKLLTQLLEKETIEPYFPLYRKGNHWLFYKAVDPLSGRVETYKEAFDSSTARNKAKILLAKEGATNIEAYERSSRAGLGQVDTKFAFELLSKLRNQGLSPELENTLLDSLFDIMPERSLVRAFKQRQDILGFKTDALKVFRERMPNFTNQIVNLKYDFDLSRISGEIADASRAYQGPDQELTQGAQNLETTLQGYIDFARNPKISTASKMAKTLGFGWTLGFNLSSALVNITNLPIVVLPYLGGRYGFKNTMKAMNDARKLFFSTGIKRRTETFTEEGQREVFEGPSMSNIDFTDPNLSPEVKELETLNNLMEARGQSNISTTSENLDMENPTNSAWTWANNAMGWMFHQGERGNRQISAITSYKLELAERRKNRKLTQKDYDEAAEQALEDTEITNSGAMLETAPRIAQNNIGNWMLMYKRFGISMYYLQAKMAKQALANALPMELRAIADSKYEGDQSKLTPEDRQEAEEKAAAKRKEAKKQIVGMFASSALFAGIQGLPLYGAVSLIANTVLLDDEDEDFDSIAASYFGEGMYSGPINAITGMDIAPRVGLSNLIYRARPNRAEQDILLDIAEFAGGPVLGVGRRVMRGAGLIAEGEVWKGTEAVLPSVLSNGLKSLRYATEGATTLRGDPIVEDIHPWNVLTQLFGFTPAGYTKQLEMNARDKGLDRRLNTLRTDMMRDYYMALKEGDTDTARELIQDMREFSQRHPFAAIDGSTLKRSIDQHQITDRIARQLGGITATRRSMQRIMQRRMEDMGEE